MTAALPIALEMLAAVLLGAGSWLALRQAWEADRASEGRLVEGRRPRRVA